MVAASDPTLAALLFTYGSIICNYQTSSLGSYTAESAQRVADTRPHHTPKSMNMIQFKQKSAIERGRVPLHKKKSI